MTHPTPTREAQAREVLAKHGIVEGFNFPVLPGYVVAVDPDAVIAAMLAFADQPRPIETGADLDHEAWLSALCDEEWKYHAGPPPEYGSPLAQVYDAGIGYAWDRLAEILGVTDYEGGDGSEDYATDVANTGRNILVAAGYTNPDGDLLTADELAAHRLAFASPLQGDREAIAAASAWLRQCSDWLLTTDLDMLSCPMETDPLDIADDLDAAFEKADQIIALLTPSSPSIARIQEAPSSIVLTPAEIQSGHSRVKWAEGLILQLPKDHDGRNSWLLNYGEGDEATQRRFRYSAGRTERGLEPAELPALSPTVSSKTGEGRC